MKVLTNEGFVETDDAFAKQVAAESGQPIESCYQCGKCTAGCPTAFAMDLAPSQVMRAAQAGLRDIALGSSSIRSRSFVVVLMAPPVAKKNQLPAAPPSMLSRDSQVAFEAVNRALPSATHSPGTVRTQPFPKPARRVSLALSPSRRKSSTKE